MLLILMGAIFGRPAQNALAQMPAGVAHADAEQSTTLSVSINGTSWQLSRQDLHAMPQTSVTVHNVHRDRDETYSGVAVSDLLARCGLPFTKDSEKVIYHSYLRAKGTDGYFVIFSGSEIESAVHKGNVIVAVQQDGEDLKTEGQFKLVATEDKRPARWVRNLLALTLTTAN